MPENENTELTENTEPVTPEYSEPEEVIGDSILKTIAKMMGPGVGDDYFNPDLIWGINAAFSRLCQLGVGNDKGTPFTISGDTEEWSDFIDKGHQEDVKQYIWLKVKMVFDPPASSTIKEAFDLRIAELEWTMREVAEVGY